MITFVNPYLSQMACGDQCIELTDAGTWDSFPAFAEHLIAQIGAELLERIDGPDVRILDIRYKATELRLVYEEMPNGISIEPKKSDGKSAILELFALFRTQSTKNGV